MFIRTKVRANGKISVHIVENFRRAYKIVQKIVRHVGQALNEKELDELKRLAQTIIGDIKEQRQSSLPLMKPENTETYKTQIPAEETVNINNSPEEQSVIDGIGDVFGKLYNDLGFGSLIRYTKTNAVWNKILRTCVLTRLANPSSKRRTASLLERDFGIRIPLNKIYKLMDYVAEQEDDIHQRVSNATMSLFPDGIDVLLFDVTTLYFYSFDDDELRKFGFSKDCKFKETQIMLALAVTTDGLPIDYLVFTGDTYEDSTLYRGNKCAKTKA
ncbi:transposase, IS4 family protein [Candidatus Magnetoovum chiemensis]|nr:transposase, IS4 family protein [Candidatus Magnetoovum chiemensis]